MKSLLATLSLALFVASTGLASADSDGCSCCSASCAAEPVSLTIAKASDSKAKLTLGSKTATAPISFTDGASWDSVKDNYTVPAATATGLEKGKVGISIAADGTASFKTKACKKK